MEPSSDAGAQPGDLRVGDPAIVPANDGRAPSAPFRLREDADVLRAVRRVGEDYWPEGIAPQQEGAQESGPCAASAAAPEVGPIPSPPPPEVPVAVSTGMSVVSVAGAPGRADGGGAPQPTSAAGPALVASAPWGEAGGFPRAPKSQMDFGPKGPIFFEAAKDPLSILMAVLLAGALGGLGAYLGWRLGGQEAARQTREGLEQRLASARGESEAREQEQAKQLQEARARVAEVERANAALELQGKEREKAGAAAQAAAQALQEQIEALKKEKAEGDGTAGKVADLVTLRGEQERLAGLLREAVGEACEVGTDGPYVFVRPKVPLYGEGSNKPGQAMVDAMKKVVGVAKAYGGPYRLQVEGHTDASPGPTVAGPGSNLHAGAMRALDIAQVLVDAGVPAPKMAIVSQGEAFPVRAGADAGAAKANRRVEIVFAPTRNVIASAPEPATPADAPVPRAVPVAMEPPAGAPAPKPVPTPAPAPAAVAAPPPPAQEPVPEAPAVIESGTAAEPVKPRL